MANMDYALVFKALGDENRLQIVRMLSGGEKCACKLLEQIVITQPTLSHHMKILCDCGLVNVRREGKWSHYSLNDGVLVEFKAFINNLAGYRGGYSECK
jgi:ArsR family transcriptional regulator, arsenate/arsenite/antimonite-responsive transcriptional repressor